MAEQGPEREPAPVQDPVVAEPAGGERPSIAPWLLLYTLGRVLIAVVLVLLLWAAGIGSYAGLLFGILLAMPVAYLVMRPVRERLNLGLVARRERKRREKDELRARLSGDAAPADDDGPGGATRA